MLFRSQAIYELTAPAGAGGAYPGYTWGAGDLTVFSAAPDEDWLTLTLANGTTMGVHIEEIGELVSP